MLRSRVKTSKPHCMRVIFHIEYHTLDTLHIIFEGGASHAMHRAEGGQWHITLDASAGDKYRYEVQSAAGQSLRTESRQHCIEQAEGAVEIFDRWYDSVGERPFYSTLFTESVFRRTEPAAAVTEGEIILDGTGKKNGRGAYICKSAQCFKKARKAKRLESSLECQIPEEIYDRLETEIANGE